MLWIGTNEGLWRIDESEKDELDRVQCFRADACMFDNNVKAVEPDGSDGGFVLERALEHEGVVSEDEGYVCTGDNDGLWTALVAMGDICRYGVMKNDPKYTPEQVEHARKVATRWTEAILLLEYIPAWKGKA